MPIDIWKLIIDKCDYISQLNLISSHKFCYDNLQITDMLNNFKYVNRLSNNIIKQKKYNNIIKLDVE